MGETRDFGPLDHISAEAIGQPGHRRFRLRAINGEGETASLWLEKEQLTALGEAISSALQNEGYAYERRPLDDLSPEPVFPLNAGIDFRLGQLSMGLNAEARAIILIAADGPEGDDSLTVTMEVDYRRSHELQRQIRDVVAAGRPPCPLCTAPMDPSGHVCVRTNGHQPH
jgi:uncharacterized repeat protein (TIGR03847 family)